MGRDSKRKRRFAMDKKEFVAEIAKLRPGSTFLVLHKYKNKAGEISDFNIIFNMSYENALKRSIAIMEKLEVPGPGIRRLAFDQVLDSFERSLHKVQTTPVEELDDTYHRYHDEDGKLIEGIKLHVESDTLHLFGLVHLKRIIVPGEYKEVVSRDLTLEKKEFVRKCPVSKFRQFILRADQLERIAVQHMSLLPPEE